MPRPSSPSLAPRWLALGLLLLAGVLAPVTRAGASPGDPLTTFGTGGVIRVAAPAGCTVCPGVGTDFGAVRLESTGSRTVFGSTFAVPATDVEDRSIVGSAVALVEAGAEVWRRPVTGPADADHLLLAVGIDPTADQVVVVVGVSRRGTSDEDPDVPVGQEIRRYSLAGDLVSTVALPASTHGRWTVAAVAPDGTVVGVTEDDTTGGLPSTTVRRYRADGSVRWTRALPAGDSIEAVDVAASGRVVLVGTRAVESELSFDGLVAAVSDAGEIDPAFGTSGRFVSPAPDGFGRAFTAVDAEGADVAIAGVDQWQGDDADDDSPPGAALVGRFRNGQPWSSFSGDGLAEQRWAGTQGMRVTVSDVIVDGDRTVVSGRATAFDSYRATASLVRWTGTGTVDGTFAIDPAAASELMGLAPIPGGYVAASPPEVVGGQWGFPLRAFAAAGSTSNGPPAPSNVRITAAGAATATVAWTPPAGSIAGYEIEVDLGADGAADLVTPAGVISSAPYRGIPTDRLASFAVRARDADGLGPRSAWTPPAVPPFRTVDAFTDRQLRDVLGRAPTSTELTEWRTALLGGARPSSRISAAIDLPVWSGVRSPVIRLYRAYFLRLPDTGGLDYWVGQSRSGRSLAQISQAFSASPEFRTLYGTLTNRQFVERIYQNILGRPGEPAGVAYWTGELDARRRTRGTVMTGFSESPEYRTASRPTVDVVHVYTAMLRRVPTTDEASLWTPVLTAGRPRTDVIAHLLGSPDYDERIPS